MEPLRAVIYMEPVAKERARLGFRNGKVISYTPINTKTAEQEIKLALLDKRPDKSISKGTPLKLTAIFYRSKPLTKTGQQVALPTTRPDLDNYLKLLLDALSGKDGFFENDAQVTTVIMGKRYGNPPRIELKLERDRLDKASA